MPGYVMKNHFKLRPLLTCATLTCLVHLAVPSVSHAQAAPTPAAIKAATSALTDGNNLFKQKKWGAALQKFQESYNTVSSPNSGLWIARCHAEMKNHKEAFRWYQRVITEAGARMAAETKYVQTHKTAQDEVAEVSKSLAVVTVTVRDAQATSTVKVAGLPVAREEWGKPLPYDPGAIEAVLETPGQQPGIDRATVAAGQTKAFDLAHPQTQIAPPPPIVKPDSGGGPGLLPVAFAFAGVGVVGMGMFAVGGGITLSNESDFEDRGVVTDDEVDSAQTLQTVANVGLIVGAVGLAAGATFLIIEVASGGDSKEQASPIELQIGPGFAGLKTTF